MRLEATGLGFGYPGHAVGRDADFAVGPGEVVCLLGPNGSGKTTLFKTLLGLLAPQAGSVAIGGEAIGALRRAEIAARIAYVPQAHVAPFPFTVGEVVLMGRTARLPLFASPGAEDREAAGAALEALAIGELAGHDYTRISGGQRQLVLIARALAQGAPLLVMDEPTASLDFGNQARVLARIAQLARAGLGIVVSTHNPDHAFALATRVVLLHEGRLVAEGPPDEVLTGEALSRIYGVGVTVERLASGRAVSVPGLEVAGDAVSQV